MPFDMPYYEFDEKRDLAHYKCWLLGSAWYPPPWMPLYSDLWLDFGTYGTQYGAEITCQPGSKGFGFIAKDGAFYVTIADIPKEERKAREPKWRERAAPILDDPWGFWNKLKDELKQMYAKRLSFDVEKADDVGLLVHFHDCWEMVRRMAEIHFHGMYGLAGPLQLFRTIIPELTGITHTDVKFAKLMSGFDNSLIDANRGLAELAAYALELKLEDNFKLADETVLPAMERSEAGRKWLAKLKEFLRVHGYHVVWPHTMSIDGPTWIEKPSLVVGNVKRMMATGGAHRPDLERERIVKERKQAEQEVLAKVPQEQRDWFGKLMKAAQASHSYSEDHNYWCELYCFSLVRRAILALGRRFLQVGLIADQEDIFYLLSREIIMAGLVHHRYALRPIVARRKEEYQGYVKRVPQVAPFFGDPTKIPELIAADVIFTVAAPAPVAKPEEVGATLVGSAGAPGVVEGVARIISGPAEFHLVQPGEILVAPSTSAPWTPIFGLIKAVVTDAGGTLAHAAIVAREYGIPAVVGTMEATKKIKTGDRIRIDGNLLRVYLLESKKPTGRR